MATLALIIGYFVIGIIAAIALLWPLEISNETEYFSVTYFQFGFLKARSEKVIKELSRLRGVERQTVFINAPKWFNTYVYNFGIRKEQK